MCEVSAVGEISVCEVSAVGEIFVCEINAVGEISVCEVSAVGKISVCEASAVGKVSVCEVSAVDKISDWQPGYFGFDSRPGRGLNFGRPSFPVQVVQSLWAISTDKVVKKE